MNDEEKKVHGSGFRIQGQGKAEEWKKMSFVGANSRVRPFNWPGPLAHPIINSKLEIRNKFRYTRGSRLLSYAVKKNTNCKIQAAHRLHIQPFYGIILTEVKSNASS